ncbi:MAG TPA: PspC domain-containing protein [Deinococcales bacterium]|nr:PspC domain-containing protein [Deinococcales bacterium]
MRFEKWYRSKNDRILSGATAGLGAYLGVHPGIVRIALLALAFGGVLTGPVSGLVIVAYIAAWVMVPEMPADLEPVPTPLVPGLVRPRDGRIVAGVAAGLARHLNVEVNLVRIAFVILAVAAGTGVLAYVAAWLVMPQAPESATR